MVDQETYSVDISRPAVVSSFEPTGSKGERERTYESQRSNCPSRCLLRINEQRELGDLIDEH